MKGLIRGCGRRQKSGCYLEISMSPEGQEIEQFLLDPPIPIDKDALGLTAIGVKLIKRESEDVWDVWDIVGESFYPNVQDFIEEARRFGISRRLSSKMDFSLLTEKSKLMTLHSRAWIANPQDYFQDIVKSQLPFECPKSIDTHTANDTPSPSCVGLWWHDIDGGQPWADIEFNNLAVTMIQPLVKDRDPRLVRRTMPAFSYEGRRRPDGVTPSYKLALFAAFPVGRLVVIRDEDGAHEATLQKAKAAKIAVALEDE